jgi:hypothetical protein
MRLTTRELKYAREWLIDCYPNQEDEIDQACTEDIESHVEREYCGGIDNFKKDCKPFAKAGQTIIPEVEII